MPSVDASLVKLCLSLFDWAKYRRAKGALKLHLLLDHDGYLPEYVHVTEGKVHEINILRRLSFNPGTIVVIDRGLIDYELFGNWTKEGIFFVTRLKKNASYRTIQEHNVPQYRNILRDQIIELDGFYSQDKCPHHLRIVEVWDEEKEESITFLTNHLEFGATTVANIYKDRWEIELFFKALKQNLRIKTFVGTSFNAVMIQIWTALIAMLILKYLKMKAKIKWPVWPACLARRLTLSDIFPSHS
jgi:IS4 transposase